MDEKQSSLSDEVIIEIVHSIKDIVIELIDKAFPKKENEYEERMKRSEIAEFTESMEEIGDAGLWCCGYDPGEKCLWNSSERKVVHQ